MKAATTNIRVPLLPLKDVVVFPRMVMPLLVGRPGSVAAVEEALASDRPLLLCAQRDADIDEPTSQNLYTMGVTASVLQTVRMPDNTLKVVVEGLDRHEIKYVRRRDDYLEAAAVPREMTPLRGDDADALLRTVVGQFEEYAHLSQRVSPEIAESLKSLTDAGEAADLLCAYMPLPVEERQALLETLSERKLLEKVAEGLLRENDLLGMEQRVRERVREQMDRGQREHFLHEQLKAIHQELGSSSGEEDFQELRDQLAKAGMPKEVREKAERELERYERMPPMSPEGTVVRTYLEWLLDMPWNRRSRESLDLDTAERVLDEDHYGLEKVKERILEFLAVRKLSKSRRGPVLCLVGPPGVGKTSLGKSVARAMGRKFIRVSLGGVRDEAEIRGHRRTYIGALPGRVIQSIKRVGVKNPVFMLDEIDKLSSDYRGDPASALLEVLDPEQNRAFSDHFLEVDFDLHQVFFITTANSEYDIPPALHDRMEVVRISGYTPYEKMQIARGFLLPKQLKEAGLSDDQIQFEDSGLDRVIQRYTEEAGVRELERQVARLCRKVARKVLTGEKDVPIVIDDAKAGELLGPEEYTAQKAEADPEIGLAVGLAWTWAGGDIMTIETTIMKGKGELLLTGQLGEVMRESAQAAHSWLRARASELGLPPRFYTTQDIHLHVPEGAIPKDGPSAGTAIAVSMLSALAQRAPKPWVAMTGEITLRGRVLEVGAIKEKVLAAHRAGVKTVILPEDNRKDLVDVPKEIQEDLTFVFASRFSEVLDACFDPPIGKAGGKKPASRSRAAAPKRPARKRPPQRR